MIHKLISLIQNSNPKLQKVVANIAWLFVDRILAMGMAFLISVMVARYLGPSQLGVVKYVQAFVFLFSPLSTLGMNSIVIRELVEQPASKNKILGTAFSLRLACGFLCSFLILLVAFFIPSTSADVRIFISIASSVFLFQAFTVFEDWFQSQVESKYIVFSKNITLFIMSALKIFLVQREASLTWFVCLPVLEAAIYSVMLIVFYGQTSKYHSFFNWKPEIDRAKYLLQESVPLLFTSIAVSLYLMADQVMLGQMVGDRAVGIYSIAVSLSEMWYMIPSIFSSSLYPSVIQLKTGDKNLYNQRLQQYYDLMAAMAYGVIICFLPTAHFIIYSLYGESYSESVQILYIHLWTCLFTFIGIAQSTWLISEGLQRFNFFATALGAVSNILLNILLIPRFSGIGAATATLISYAGASYFFHLIFPETRENALLMTRSLFLFFRVPKNLLQRLRNRFSN